MSGCEERLAKKECVGIAADSRSLGEQGAVFVVRMPLGALNHLTCVLMASNSESLANINSN